MRVRAHAGRAVAACVASVALASVAGQPQPIVYALLFALPYAALAARGADDGARAYALRALPALALGVGCAALQLVPEAELFRASARATYGFERFQEFTVPVLQQPLRLFFPYALGSSALAPYTKSGMNIGSFAEMSDYAGISGVILAIVAIRRARRDTLAAYWIVAAAVGLVLATGNQLGIGWLTYHIPLYGLFRAPGRVACEVDLAIAVLAGYGIAAVASGRARADDVRRSCAIVALAMVLSCLLFALLSRLPPKAMELAISGWATLDPNPFENAALAIPFATLVFVAAVLSWWAARPAVTLRRAAVLAAVLADMLGFAYFGYWRSAAFGAEALAPRPYAADLRARLSALHQRLVSVPLDGVDDGGINPNLNLLWNVPSLRGYTTLQLARTHDFFDSDWGAPVWPLAPALDRTLDLAAVRFVIVTESPDVEVDHASVDPVTLFMRTGPRWRYLERDGPDNILENEHALPRAWIVHRTFAAAGIDVLAAIHAGTFDPRTTAYVEGPNVPPATRAAPGDEAVVVALQPTRMRVRVRCGAPCYLVTSDTTYPGWSATIDGTATPIYATDEALRGVRVPAGSHDVVFEYEARSLELGLAVSGLCLVLTVALSLALRRPARRDEEPFAASNGPA
jgi:hypothetical protein